MLNGSCELSHNGYSPAAFGWFSMNPMASSMSMHTTTVAAKNWIPALTRVARRATSAVLSGISTSAQTTTPTPYTRNGYIGSSHTSESASTMPNTFMNEQ